MSELYFESSLSIEEIDANFNNVDFFDGIMAGLNEVLAYEKGTAASQTFARKSSLPDINVSELRKSLDMTQKVFASVLGVSPRTVEAWEIGKSTPTPTARKLMKLISLDHTLIKKMY